MNIDVARINMLKQQIRTCYVLDDDLLNLISQVPREEFVPPAYQQLAYADEQLKISHDQVMMLPSIEAKMLQSLAIQSSDKILEIGTGTGYVTALLAKSGQHVYSIDIFADFIQAAKQRLTKLGIENVTLQEGNGGNAWEKQQPYDVICVTGSLPTLPDNFRQQLKLGGRLFVILGEGQAMQATLITRLGENEWDSEILFETNIPSLLNIEKPSHFKF